MTNKLKLLPREATREMLEAMDECSMEGYDERLYAGHAGSVYMAAWDAFYGQHCYCGDITNLGVIHRDDGPCHYPDHKESEQEPEFVTHNVDKPYDWSEWVCPNPSGYLMKCCDCGLVHEADFGVVRYKSETEREDCDMVDDPNLQAVFRMRRSEKWSPEDTAHRAGGLPITQPEQEKERCVGCEACIDTACGRDECPKGWPKAAQPEQEPVALETIYETIIQWDEGGGKRSRRELARRIVSLYTTPPQRTWVGLKWNDVPDEWVGKVAFMEGAKWADKQLKEKNTK